MSPQNSPSSDWRRIELTRSGGQLPTFKPHIALTLDSLAATDRDALLQLLQTSNFSTLPARFSGHAHPDAYTYRLSAWNADGVRTVEFSDDDGHPAALDAVRDWLLAHKP